MEGGIQEAYTEDELGEERNVLPQIEELNVRLAERMSSEDGRMVIEYRVARHKRKPPTFVCWRHCLVAHTRPNVLPPYFISVHQTAARCAQHTPQHFCGQRSNVELCAKEEDEIRTSFAMSFCGKYNNISP